MEVDYVGVGCFRVSLTEDELKEVMIIANSNNITSKEAFKQLLLDALDYEKIDR